MRTYKTWEVIKMLSENPKLKFGTKYSDAFKNGNGYIVFKNIDCRDGFDGNFKGNEEWLLIQEPVDFMTAVQSEKRVKIEHELLRGYTVYEDYSNINYLLGLLVDIFDGKGIRKVLTEGKFYIEE